MSIEIRDRADLLLLCLANGPANILSVGNGMAATLAQAIGDAQSQARCRAIVIAGRGDMFCGGADLGDLDRADALRDLFDRIEQSRKPVIMAIHGMALGGGVELALAGHCRIAAQGTRFALPEVALGLLPGLGGTQRLPRLIGAGPALDMMLSGDMISADAARAAGLIDRISEGDIVDAAIGLLADDRIMPRTTRSMPPPADAREIVAARRRALVPGPNRAPQRILDCVAAISDDFEAGMRREAELIEELIVSETSRGLRHAFFAQRTAARVPGLARGERVGVPATARVIGAGVLARQTAARLVEAGVRVRFDAMAAFPIADDAGTDLIVQCGAGRAAAHEAVTGDALLATHRLHPAVRGGPDVLEGVDAAKRIEFHCPGDSMLMEVVRCPDSAPATIASMVALGKALGKTTVVSGDIRGSIFERLAIAYVAPVASFFAMGLTADRINKALERWGMAEGPCKIGRRLGLLTDESPDTIISGSCPLPSDEEIVERFLLALSDEGARLIADGVAWRADDVDVAAISGLGFPRERGGPMFQADRIGLPVVMEKLGDLESRTGGGPHIGEYHSS